MAYQIEWKRSATKQLKQLPLLMIPRVLRAVESLSQNPYQPGIKKLAVAEFTYRLRVGDYRIIYTVDDDILIVEIVQVGHRKDVYR